MTTIRILVRRWYVVILGLALTGTAANAVRASIAPTYQTLGSVLLIAPTPQRVVGQQVDTLSLNPFTRFSAATTVLATITVQIMDNAEVRERLAAEGAVLDYQVGIAPDQTPIVYVTVVNASEALAVRANVRVLAGINEELDRRQAVAGAPEESRVRSLIITEPTRGTQLVGGRVRAVLAVAVLGLAASLSTAFVVEGFAQSRKRRRAAASGSKRGRRARRQPTDGQLSPQSEERPREPAAEAVESAVERAPEPAAEPALDEVATPAISPRSRSRARAIEPVLDEAAARVIEPRRRARPPRAPADREVDGAAETAVKPSGRARARRPSGQGFDGVPGAATEPEAPDSPPARRVARALQSPKVKPGAPSLAADDDAGT